MQKIIATMITFLVLGMTLVAFAFGLIILFYLVLFGAIAGLVLFVALWIRERFFMGRRHDLKKSDKMGRTINHDE